MVKQWKRMMSLLLALIMIFAIPITEVSAEEADAVEIAVRVIHENPVYSDAEDTVEVIDGAEGLEAIHLEANPDDTIYTSKSAAAVSVRENLVARDPAFSVKYKMPLSQAEMDQEAETEYSYLRQQGADILDLAVQHTGMGKEGDSLGLGYSYSNTLTRISYSSMTRMVTLTIEYEIKYNTDAAQEAALDQKVAAILAQLDVSDGTDYEKIRAVYDYLTENVTYDKVNLNDKDYRLKYTPYAALINGTSVCQGYALAFYRLMLELGVDTRVVAGTGNGGPHAWNIVQLDGVYYALDATWDAGTDPYLFFLLDEETFAEEHEREPKYLTPDFMEAYPMANVTYVPGHVHQVDVTPQIDPTCEMTGLTARSRCADCGLILIFPKEIPALDHDMAVRLGIAATCEESGRTDETYCARCNKVFIAAEPIPALGHTPVPIGSAAATCTESGLTEGAMCSTCQVVLEAQEEIPALGHAWDQGTVIKEATCTEEGVLTYRCTRCDETRDESIALAAHTWITDEKVEPTCVATGLTEGSHCGVCGLVQVEQVTINKTPHRWVDDPKVEPTCISNGWTEGKHCGDCGYVLIEQEPIEMLPHSWSEPVIAKEPTCLEEGIKRYTCTSCSLTRDESIDTLPHTVGVLNYKAPTCTEEGKTEGAWCTTCGMILTEQEEIPATGHQFENTVIKEATCTEPGEKQMRCAKCGAAGSEPETITVVDHTVVTQIKKATQTADGSIKRVCATCGTCFSEERIPAANSCKIKLGYTTTVYSGSQKKPSVKIYDGAGKLIDSGRYTVKYGTNKVVGKGTVTVNYSSSYYAASVQGKVTFTINPKPTSIASLTASSKGFTVKWKKQATQTSGYQIRYATSSTMTKAKTVTVTKNTTVSKKITKLLAKKRYYVQVRTYKKVGTAKYYSTWSAKKYVTTKS